MGILVKIVVACSLTENDDVPIPDYVGVVVAFSRVMMSVEAFAVESGLFAVEVTFVGEATMKIDDDDESAVDAVDAVDDAVVVIEEDQHSSVAQHHEQIDTKGIPGLPFHNPDS